MLEKKIVYEHSITEHGQIQVKLISRILEDGRIISEPYHQRLLNPGDAVEKLDERTKKIAKAIWTPEVLEAFQVLIAAEK